MKKISIVLIVIIVSIIVHYRESIVSYYYYYAQLSPLGDVKFTESLLRKDIVNYSNGETHISISGYETRGTCIVSAEKAYFIMGTYSNDKLEKVFLLKFSNTHHFQWGRSYNAHNSKLNGKHLFLSDSLKDFVCPELKFQFNNAKSAGKHAPCASLMNQGKFDVLHLATGAMGRSI